VNLVECIIILWNKIENNHSFIDKLQTTHQKLGSKMLFKIVAFYRMFLTLSALQNQLFNMILSDSLEIKCTEEAVGAAAENISKHSNLWNVFTICHPNFVKYQRIIINFLKVVFLMENLIIFF
jgi:hypothetical protein